MQSYKTVQIEKLSALLPIPILYQSRRRHLQRFLVLKSLKVKYLWFPVMKKWLKINQSRQKVVYVAMDRTQWKERNLFVASLIKEKRAIPLNWFLLDKKGSSNFSEQKRLRLEVLRNMFVASNHRRETPEDIVAFG
ncbi:MAG: hypothetical protein WBG70_23200 [Spirulinaceae cyanobacterium]